MRAGLAEADAARNFRLSLKAASIKLDSGRAGNTFMPGRFMIISRVIDYRLEVAAKTTVAPRRINADGLGGLMRVKLWMFVLVSMIAVLPVRAQAIMPPR